MNLRELLEYYKDMDFPDFHNRDISTANSTGHTGDSLLHIASMHGREDHIKVLIDHGADVNCRGEMNYTPLHWAAKSGNLSAYKLLVDYGSNEMALSDFGETPQEILLRSTGSTSQS